MPVLKVFKPGAERAGNEATDPVVRLPCGAAMPTQPSAKPIVIFPPPAAARGDDEDALSGDKCQAISFTLRGGSVPLVSRGVPFSAYAKGYEGFGQKGSPADRPVGSASSVSTAVPGTGDAISDSPNTELDDEFRGMWEELVREIDAPGDAWSDCQEVAFEDLYDWFCEQQRIVIASRELQETEPTIDAESDGTVSDASSIDHEVPAVPPSDYWVIGQLLRGSLHAVEDDGGRRAPPYMNRRRTSVNLVIPGPAPGEVANSVPNPELSVEGKLLMGCLRAVDYVGDARAVASKRDNAVAFARAEPEDEPVQITARSVRRVLVEPPGDDGVAGELLVGCLHAVPPQDGDEDVTTRIRCLPQQPAARV